MALSLGSPGAVFSAVARACYPFVVAGLPALWPWSAVTRPPVSPSVTYAPPPARRL